MSFIKYTKLTAAQKFTDNIYCLQLPSPEPVVWRATPPSDAAVQQTAHQQTHHPPSSTVLTWQARPSVAWHIPLADWGTDWVLFRNWRMLENNFSTQGQRCPWVSASSNNRLGSSIWAAIISDRFVYFGSFSPGGERSSLKRSGNVVLRNGEVAGCCDPIIHRVSHSLPQM